MKRSVECSDQILLNFDPDLLRSPLGTFNPLLQWWRRVPWVLLPQGLSNNQSSLSMVERLEDGVSVYSFSWSISKWGFVPAVLLPPAPAFSWVSEWHVSEILGPVKLYVQWTSNQRKTSPHRVDSISLMPLNWSYQNCIYRSWCREIKT